MCVWTSSCSMRMRNRIGQAISWMRMCVTNASTITHTLFMTHAFTLTAITMRVFAFAIWVRMRNRACAFVCRVLMLICTHFCVTLATITMCMFAFAIWMRV